MDEDEELAVETIELAMTRPSMLRLPYLGELPVVAAAIVFVTFGVLMGLTGSWKWLVAIPPTWWGASRLIALDYHAFTRVQLWLASSAWSRDAAVEGGASTSPFPVAPPAHARLLGAIGLRRARPRGIG